MRGSTNPALVLALVLLAALNDGLASVNPAAGKACPLPMGACGMAQDAAGAVPALLVAVASTGTQVRPCGT